MGLKNNSQAQNKTDEVKPDLKNVSRDILQVVVRDPDKVLFSGEAVTVSSKNSVGPFDILPQHENFISLLTDKITIYMDKHGKQEIPNTSAIVKAKLNKVNIFLGISSLINKQQIGGQPLQTGTSGSNAKQTPSQSPNNPQK